MIYIAHRGNINGPNKERENSPDYIDEAINLGYNVEVDLWSVDNLLYLGHDKAEHYITLNWLLSRSDKLWIHCKNTDALVACSGIDEFNFFWHEEDTATLTSHKWIWAYPGKQPIPYSIAVMPELYDDIVSKCAGICTDYINRYVSR
ncbi:hypothetical protein UFOVP49_156 [uncultured Caudovirales phage]|uniref:Uncharacterized protein n=1 Tax=uncultured Caudovirales phage TaxID=2100421 RepID=A0A6J5KPS9_9CAUD|nr:hypothetical protein UFOVP49_156 [uncultured Caudovirales phage]